MKKAVLKYVFNQGFVPQVHLTLPREDQAALVKEAKELERKRVALDAGEPLSAMPAEQRLLITAFYLRCAELKVLACASPQQWKGIIGMRCWGQCQQQQTNGVYLRSAWLKAGVAVRLVSPA